jgi:hypothetical protein
MHFLNDAQEHRTMVESAFDYHDIGLWTAGDLAYLELSEDLALDANREKGFGLDPGTLRIGDPLAPQGDGVRRTERRPRQRRAEGAVLHLRDHAGSE